MLKAVLVGGGACPPALIDSALSHDWPVYTTYGMTETASQVATPPPGAPAEWLRSSGRILRWCELRIAETGEVLVKGPVLFSGYLQGGRTAHADGRGRVVSYRRPRQALSRRLPARPRPLGQNVHLGQRKHPAGRSGTRATGAAVGCRQCPRPDPRRTYLKELHLDTNLFTGSVPASITKSLDLRILVLSDNAFDDLPVIVDLKGLDSISVARNALTFEDLESNMALANGNFTYAPQDSVELTMTNTLGSIVFSVDVGGSQNRYRWYKNNVRIESATEETLAVDEADAPAYYKCEITNSLVPDLALTSRRRATGTVTATDERERPGNVNALHESWPNPASGTLTVSFDAERRSRVRLSLYDALGRRLAVAVDRVYEAGRHEVTFDASAYRSGAYFMAVEIGDWRATRRLVIVR